MTGRRGPLSASALALVGLLVVAPAAELDARGGFRGGGFSRGGGGGFHRGGAARGGSIGGYQRSRGMGSMDRRGDADFGSRSSRRERWEGSQPGDSWSREGSFENRRGETVDWDTTVTRGEDGLERETNWESSSGASGSGSSSVRVEDGRVEGVDRSRHVENAEGDTLDREVSSHREGDRIEREGSIESSTGIDAETEGSIEKTDDGFVAQGAVAGEEGAAAGTIVKDGDDVYARGVATDGDNVTWARAHCSGGECVGGRVSADIYDYWDDPYYYYPYYYGWYSCPPGSVQTWYGAYGTPVYGCSNVVVVHTTIALGVSDSTSSGAASAPSEAQVTSAPVLMYEIDPEVVVYATSYAPQGVYAAKQAGRYFWAPGPSEDSADTKQWFERAGSMASPTANATVITYQIGPRIVYLTNERPVPGFYAEPADKLFAWLPGVRDPSDEERDAIRTAVTAQRAGGEAALDREARKLEKDRDPPPAT